MFFNENQTRINRLVRIFKMIRGIFSLMDNAIIDQFFLYFKWTTRHIWNISIFRLLTRPSITNFLCILKNSCTWMSLWVYIQLGTYILGKQATTLISCITGHDISKTKIFNHTTEWQKWGILGLPFFPNNSVFQNQHKFPQKQRDRWQRLQYKCYTKARYFIIDFSFRRLLIGLKKSPMSYSFQEKKW